MKETERERESVCSFDSTTYTLTNFRKKPEFWIWDIRLSEFILLEEKSSKSGETRRSTESFREKAPELGHYRLRWRSWKIRDKVLKGTCVIPSQGGSLVLSVSCRVFSAYLKASWLGVLLDEDRFWPSSLFHLHCATRTYPFNPVYCIPPPLLSWSRGRAGLPAREIRSRDTRARAARSVLRHTALTMRLIKPAVAPSPWHCFRELEKFPRPPTSSLLIPFIPLATVARRFVKPEFSLRRTRIRCSLFI